MPKRTELDGRGIGSLPQVGLKSKMFETITIEGGPLLVVTYKWITGVISPL